MSLLCTVIPMLPRLLVFGFLAVCLTSKISAEEDEVSKGKPGWTVTAECQMLLVPQKLAIGLIAELGDDQNMEAAWARAQKLIEQGEIELLAVVVLKGNAGERLISETIEEVRYPTEFDPPQLPDRVPEENAAEVLKLWPAVGVTPTAFETRNVGQTLELEAKVSADGQWINAEVVPQHVRFLRWVRFEAGQLPNEKHLGIEQPYFHTMKNQLHLRMRNGQRVLVGTHKLPDPDQKAFELFILQLKATRSDASE